MKIHEFSLFLLITGNNPFVQPNKSSGHKKEKNLQKMCIHIDKNIRKMKFHRENSIEKITITFNSRPIPYSNAN